MLVNLQITTKFLSKMDKKWTKFKKFHYIWLTYLVLIMELIGSIPHLFDRNKLLFQYQPVCVLLRIFPC